MRLLDGGAQAGEPNANKITLYDYLVGMNRTAKILVCFVLALASFTLNPKPARAEDPDPVSIVVNSVSAVSIILGRTGEIQISGTITNSSDSSLTWVTAEFWRNRQPVTTPDQLAELISSGRPLGGGRLRGEENGNLIYLTREKPFASGQSQPFTVRATVADLGITTEGAYQIGVQVRALTKEGQVRTVGTRRWLVPAVNRTHPHSTLVLLASGPTMVGRTALADDSLLSGIDGHLGDLVSLAERPGTRFALDPALYDEVTVLSAKHTVAGVEKGPEPKAAAFKSRLDALISRGDGFRLPYGDPRLDLAERSGTLPQVIDLIRSANVPATASLPLAVVGGNQLSEQVVSQVNPSFAFVDNVLASSSNVIRTTTFAKRGLPDRVEPQWGPRQVMLAQELVSSLAGTPLTRVVRTPEDVEQEKVFQPWRTSSALLPGTAQAKWQPAIPAESLNEELSGTLVESDKLISLYRDLSSPADSLTQPSLMLLRARSAQLSPTSALALLKAAPELAGSPAQLRAQPSFVMTGRSNVFPLSVTNRSGLPIRVKMVFNSASPQRINAKDTPSREVAPGETVGFDVELTSTGSAVVPIQAWLASESGNPVTQPTTITVTSTDAGMLAWFIIVGAGVLLVGGTAWRIKAVRRESRQGEPSS